MKLEELIRIRIRRYCNVNGIGWKLKMDELYYLFGFGPATLILTPLYISLKILLHNEN